MNGGKKMGEDDNITKKRPLFSIVTPSYNSWKYMVKYWESLEGQVFKDFEVILIDDNSKDDTYSKLKNYIAASKLDIKLFQNPENHGPGYTRNQGIREAVGDWITFVDSDDSVDIHLLEKAAGIIKSNERAAVPINCIVYDYNAVHGEEKMYMKSIYGENRGGIYPTEYCVSMVRNHVIGKFYKTDLVRNTAFPELKRCEDVAFVCQAIDACCVKDGRNIGCVYYLKEALYDYNQRIGSLSNDKTLDAKDMEKAYEVIREKFGDRYVNEVADKSIPDLLYGGTLMLCKAGKSKREIISYLDKYEKEYPSWRKSSMVNRLGKAKKIFLLCISHRWIFLLTILSKIHSRLI